VAGQSFDIPLTSAKPGSKTLHNDAKTIRRLDDLLEASYQRFRADQIGADMSPAAPREIHFVIENDPTWKSTAGRWGNLDKIWKRGPELLQWKEELIMRAGAED
jgi:hypothetical protein